MKSKSYPLIGIGRFTKKPVGLIWKYDRTIPCMEIKLSSDLHAVIYPNSQVLTDDRSFMSSRYIDYKEFDDSMDLTPYVIKSESTNFWFYNRSLSKSMNSAPDSRYCAWINMYLVYEDKESFGILHPIYKLILDDLSVRVGKSMANLGAFKYIKSYIEVTEKPPKNIFDKIKSMLFGTEKEYSPENKSYTTVNVHQLDINRCIKKSVSRVTDTFSPQDVYQMEEYRSLAFFTVHTIPLHGPECLFIDKSDYNHIS